MPKAILAIRSYPATLLLALFLFLATLIVTTGSLGKVGTGGGDSGDGGSGIGGTGRSGEFGGSGFGGTGGPSPFFTSVEDEEQAVPAPAVLNPVESQELELITEIASGEAPDPALQMIDDSLKNVIEEVVAQHPLAQESRVILAVDDAAAGSVVAENGPASNSMPLSENTYSTVAEHTPATESVVMPDVIQQVAETVPVKMETAPELIDQEIDRRSLPDRVQRPDLPPFQRIRPVERASILPPRVQPMRI